MAHGLPDFWSSMEASLTKAINITSGLDADKSASPAAGDVYAATDTERFYLCFVDGDWTDVPAADIIIHAALPDVHHARLHTMSDAADHDGRAALSQMPAGLLNYILTGQGGTSDPVYKATSLVKTISYTRDETLASGNVSYTGIGFQPTCLIIFAKSTVLGSVSIGACDVSLIQMALFGYPGNITISLVKIVYIYDGASTQLAALTSFDSDGFTLAWVKGGTPAAGDINMTVFAFS